MFFVIKHFNHNLDIPSSFPFLHQLAFSFMLFSTKSFAELLSTKLLNDKKHDFMSSHLDVQETYVAGVRLDEIATRFDFVAHKIAYSALGFGGIVDVDLQKRTARGLHRRFP